MSEAKWIPCKDRLPEKQGKYLVTSQCGAINILYYSSDLYSADKEAFYHYKTHKKAGWYTLNYEYGEYFECSAPEAWQELPEPYEEEEDDK